MKKIEEIRNEIDVIDDKIADLYLQRMAAAKEIGLAKVATGVATENSLREKAIINRVTAKMPDDLKLYAKQVYETLFSTSKAYQSACGTLTSSVQKDIISAVNDGIKPFPVSATVACQGVAGAYSQIAAEKMFDISDIVYLKDWNAVFNAVEKGLCEYGVLPIENSSVGSVIGVYDLMRKYRCYIVRSVKLRIQHHLLAKNGVNKTDIKEVFSHEQALGQCAEYIKSLGNVKVTVCDNTARAAEIVAESGRTDVACISSYDCAGIYGLNVLDSDIQDNDGNYTRFIAISKKLSVYEDANKISITVNLPHEAGSLNRLLNRFSTLGLNLTKLESRPIANSPFEFAFYFDFEAKITRKDVQNLIAELDNSNEQFVFLGSYQEL